MEGRMDGSDLEEVIDTLRGQALDLEKSYGDRAADSIAAWEANKPDLLDTIQALSQTRDLVRKVCAAAPIMHDPVSYGQLRSNNVKRVNCILFSSSFPSSAVSLRAAARIMHDLIGSLLQFQTFC
jgi:hypothetical protein